jgi:sphingomyelin phosphodiesterase
MPFIFIIDFLYRNYDHVAGLWQHEGWLPDAAVEFAQSHYAAYMVKRTDGLRIITLNTDLCKRDLTSL